MSFMPGQTPPESCQPPPEPPSHSPSSAARQHEAALVFVQTPAAIFAWPVARMQTDTSAASRFVETASREPFGMSLTLLTSSRPRPGPAVAREQDRARLVPEPSIAGGTMPAAMTAALSNPR